MNIHRKKGNSAYNLHTMHTMCWSGLGIGNWMSTQIIRNHLSVKHKFKTPFHSVVSKMACIKRYNKNE